MCGIAGFSLSRSETLNSKHLTAALLMQIQTRGQDATGMAYLSGEQFRLNKAPVPAYKFVGGVHKKMQPTTLAVLHTRWATKGAPENNKNNHPIHVGKIVGVHNGHLSNDDNLFTYLDTERIGQVDSEAAFALLDRTKYHPTEVLASLQGRAALAWLDTRSRNDLHLARVSGSPLAICQTKHGSLIFASTLGLLLDACRKAGVKVAWADEIEEYTYLRVRHGVIHECLGIGDSVKQIA